MQSQQEKEAVIGQWEAGPTFPATLVQSPHNLRELATAIMSIDPLTVQEIDNVVASLTAAGKLHYSAPPVVQQKDEMPHTDIPQLAQFNYVEDFNDKQKVAAFLRSVVDSRDMSLHEKFATKQAFIKSRGLRKPVVEAAPQVRVQRTPQDLITLEEARNAIERYRDSKGAATTIARKKILVELYDAAVAKGQYADDVLAAVKQRIDGWNNSSVR